MSKDSKRRSVLIVDDEKDIVDFLKYNIEKEDYRVYTAENGEKAVEMNRKVMPSMILMDVMMPQMDGIEACRVIRNDPLIHQPIIVFLTSRSEDYSQIAAFDAGGDDYISKPIRPRLLIKRIEAIFRRVNKTEEPNRKSLNGDLSIDRDKFIVSIKGDEMYIPKKEFELLELLMSKPGKVFKRDQILSVVWGNDTIVGERTIDVHIRKLREKLGDAYIRTIKGVGYTFSEK
ncbi:MAG: DNA-binding response regulator [Flavobacteriales bacterium TMED123]|nr:response regulator transcription factor [Crocinitomicaceae bacterium]OUV69828.1 MAG: DNA-binding response regulator [Flavobacteriales bacterium TMED123]